MTADELRAWPVWKGFDTIELAEMSAVKLMNRVDTKFLLPQALLGELLERAKSDYRVQVIGGDPVAAYDSLYYDTAGLYMYTRHHDRQLSREKVRCRNYVGSDLAFLEVKHKNSKGRTKKKRVRIPVADFLDFKRDAEAVDFLRKEVPFALDSLLPQLHTVFNRVTLVDREKTERLTLDFNLRFVNVQTGLAAELGPLVVMELKQDGLCRSRMKRILIDMRVHPFKMSKYCIGTVLTNPAAKRNRFKPKLIRIRKLIEKYQTNTYEK